MRNIKFGILLAAAGLAACESGMDLSLDAQADVSFQVEESGGVLGSSPPNEVRSGGHVITVTQATITASRIALEGSSQAAQASNVTFDLPVRGGIVTAAQMGVESGVFTQLELALRSIRLRGTHDGQPFDITVRSDATTELRLFPPVMVEEGEHTNVTVRVELRDWFRADNGGLIEPRRVQGEAALQARLQANVLASLQAFLDLNADGQAG